jgi:hypothetical protein
MLFAFKMYSYFRVAVLYADNQKDHEFGLYVIPMQVAT